MKNITGKIISTSGDKTAVVEVKRWRKHPIIGKRYQSSRKMIVHTDNKQLQKDQVVILQATRPRSLRKAWRIVSIGVDNAST